jgi:pimeloyl-ACP methyl ester carboxylesterase
VEHRFVRATAIRMHVAEAGAGDPVLPLHGWPQHRYCWRRVIPRLAADHRLLCADLRGFGWSDAPRSSYATQELADDVIALLDALELDRVRLVGHDWGAFVAFLAALRAPERFSELLALSMIQPWAMDSGDDPHAARAPAGEAAAAALPAARCRARPRPAHAAPAAVLRRPLRRVGRQPHLQRRGP